MQSLKNIVINVAMILALLFGLTVSSAAETPSFEAVKARAEQGSSNSQGMLGDYYANGQGVRQDYSKALYWYQKSANQGDKYSQFNVGTAYANGQGVRQDYSKALYWYQKSAKQNNHFAQSYIGTMHEAGQGVRQNKATAKEWYGKACDNGFQHGCDDYKRLNEQGY